MASRAHRFISRPNHHFSFHNTDPIKSIVILFIEPCTLGDETKVIEGDMNREPQQRGGGGAHLRAAPTIGLEF